MQKMTIGIDANEANVKNKVGVNVFAFELLSAIYKLQANSKNNKEPINYILYLSDKPRKDMPKETSWWKYKVLPARNMWILTRLTPLLFKNPDNIDVFFSPSHYLPPFLKVPGVCSIMDLGYLEFSGQFTKKDFWQLKWWSARSISISKHIIAISKSTKRDIVRHYHKSDHMISVVYPSYDKKRFTTHIAISEIERVKKNYTIVHDYVLYLSTLKPSKNVEGLIEAFSKVVSTIPQEEKINLVVAGKKGWLYESIFKKAEELGLKNRVIFTDFVSEKDKPALIAGAKVFVLPSFWEGFGFDPLYAMAEGVAVVVSNAGSLPEVVGDAGLIIDPNNTNDIAEKITKVLTMNKESYNKLIKKGLDQAEKFSWEVSANKVVDILRKAVNK